MADNLRCLIFIVVIPLKFGYTERKEVVKGNAAEDNSKVKKQTPKKAEKIGRNEPCPCGSGKKYKQCCGK